MEQTKTDRLSSRKNSSAMTFKIQNHIDMKSNLIILIAILLAACGNVQTNNNRGDELTQLVVIKGHNSTKQGYGVNVVAEIENKSTKKIKFVSVDFTWYDKNGGLITSQNGNTTNVDSNDTGIVDSYFDEMPEGATYKAKIKDVVFY